MWYKLSDMEGWETVQEWQDGVELLQLLHNITFQKYCSKYYMLKLVEAERNLMLCFQNTTMSVSKYTR